MKYKIERASTVPAYLQLYHQIRKDITEGAYRLGDKLPSKRILAEETGISVITVEHSYDLLTEEGYIESRERSGYFAAYREGDLFSVPLESETAQETHEDPGRDERFEIREAAEDRREAFPFSILARTMRRVITEYGDRILVKSPNNGVPELREAISQYLRRSRGIMVKPDQLVIGSGAEYLYTIIVQMLGSERIFGLEDPSYDKIRKVYEASGVKCDMLKLGKEGIRSGELKRTRASVLHVTPFNSYPSGITASASKRNEYIRWAEERGGIIIEDDFDSEFSMSAKAEDTLFSLEPEHTVIYVNTFSETIAPSVRIGYLILPEALAGVLWERVSFYSCTVPVFEQYVLSEFIRDGDFERHINRVRRRRRQRRESML